MAESLEQLVERARAALGGASADTPAGQEPPPEPAEYGGADASRRVRAVVTSDGHLHALTIDPDLLHEPLVEVAVAVRSAINAALAERPGRADLAPLVDVLTRVREQSRREMAIVTAGFQDVETGVRAVREAQRNGARGE